MKAFTDIIDSGIVIYILKETLAVLEIEDLASLNIDDMKNENFETKDIDDYGYFECKYRVTIADEDENVLEFEELNEILNQAEDTDQFLELLEENKNSVWK